MTPGAGRDQIDGVVDGTLHARVAARPVGGSANDSLRGLLARSLDIAPSRVRIVVGETGRRKTLEFDGVAPETLRSRWPGVDV